MVVLDKNTLSHLEVEVVWNRYVVGLEVLGTIAEHLVEVVRLIAIELQENIMVQCGKALTCLYDLCPYPNGMIIQPQ